VNTSQTGVWQFAVVNYSITLSDEEHGRHITQLTPTCFGVVRQIRSTRRCLTSSARTMLVTCSVFARLDYCNAVLAGCDLDRLQSIQNAAVRLIAGARQLDHVTPLLKARHWLPIEQRIIFKLSVMMYKTDNGMAPSYLQEFVILPASSRSSLRLRSADTSQLFVPKTRTVLGGHAFAVAGPRTWNMQSVSDGAVCTNAVYIQE
jgi:hypothetical protein